MKKIVMSFVVAIFILPLLSFAGEYEMGFQNSNGSQDTVNLETGEYEMGFHNPDGSQDTFRFGGDQDSD